MSLSNNLLREDQRAVDVVFLIQLSKLASEDPYLLEINPKVDPFFNNASISGRYWSSLLLPGTLGRPSFTPAAFQAFNPSLVLAEIRSRSIPAYNTKHSRGALACHERN